MTTTRTKATSLVPPSLMISTMSPFTNVFCFGAFSDKNTGAVYNNCTGNFPFMSLDGNICFL